MKRPGEAFWMKAEAIFIGCLMIWPTVHWLLQ